MFWQESGLEEQDALKVIPKKSGVSGILVNFKLFFPGYILWPEDSTCHRPFYQGPCDLGQILVNQPQAWIYFSFASFLTLKFLKQMFLGSFMWVQEKNCGRQY